MKSMTGYGRGVAEADGNRLSIEIASVNGRRQVDARTALPRELTALEPFVKRLIGKRLRRGTLTVNVECELNAHLREGMVRIDRELAAHLAGQLREVAAEAGMAADVRAGELLAVPGVVVESGTVPVEALRALAERALADALDELEGMRDAEGAVLRADLLQRHALLHEQLEQMSAGADEAFERQRERLHQRVAKLGVEMKLDDERLAKEVAFCAERSDIAEELVRLGSHLAQLREMFDSDEDVGRSLDFLCQEMAREISTVCAKTRETGIAAVALSFKSELARVREQVMNVE